ncbi:L-threonylcarbamoyladenylate synthase [Clostridium sp. SM-530-WT-3G]|uniref:L-threonylcarbamoyladenylate synthase n=1 Tax=Clostridium sp. SM-530-WT-3G TaxID=2725303 RepID=UPI00145EC6B1|nr:threonylcarbamoyl-AMP synthase [Clostridium sp. SM-530-WT-3G]
MKTEVYNIQSLGDERLIEVAECIKGGGVIAYPTETLYGLGADALNEEAVKKIFKAKGRPDNKAITVITASKNIDSYVKEVPEVAQKLIDEFWPGPLTLVLKKKDVIPNITSANLDSIGIRMTSNELARKLVELSGTIITATSANISGGPSHDNIEGCIEDFDGKIDYIIGEDKKNIGIGSTIVDCTVNPPVVLRHGAVTMEMLQKIEPNIKVLD